MITAGKVGSVRTGQAGMRRNRFVRIGRKLLGWLKWKDPVFGKANAPRGFPSPREAREFRRERELQLAKLHFYARLPM